MLPERESTVAPPAIGVFQAEVAVNGRETPPLAGGGVGVAVGSGACVGAAVGTGVTVGLTVGVGVAAGAGGGFGGAGGAGVGFGVAVGAVVGFAVGAGVGVGFAVVPRPLSTTNGMTSTPLLRPAGSVPV